MNYNNDLSDKVCLLWAGMTVRDLLCFLMGSEVYSRDENYIHGSIYTVKSLWLLFCCVVILPKCLLNTLYI